MSGTALISLVTAGFMFLLGWLAVIGIQGWRRRTKIRRRMSPIVGLLPLKSRRLSGRQPTREKAQDRKR